MKIRPEHIFPILLMLQYVGAGVVYAFRGKPWNAAYWAIFALGLAYIVTFKLKP